MVPGGPVVLKMPHPLLGPCPLAQKQLTAESLSLGVYEPPTARRMQNPVKTPLGACQVQAENYFPTESYKTLALDTQWPSQGEAAQSTTGAKCAFDYFLPIQPQASSGKDKGTVNSTVL